MTTPKPASAPIQLTTSDARQLALSGAALDLEPPSRVTPAAFAAITRRLRLVQLDAISSVARSHYLVFFARLGIYNTAMLDRLLAPKGPLSECWAHAACIISANDSTHLRLRREFESRRTLSTRKRSALGPHPDRFLDSVLTRISTEGPLRARDLGRPAIRDTWWSRSPNRIALELLFRRGKLAAYRTPAFERVFDIPKRVLRGPARPCSHSDEACVDWAVLGSLASLGVGTLSDIVDYYRLPPSVVRTSLGRLERRNKVLRVQVAGWPAITFMRKDAQLSLRNRRCQRTTFLSPFDNLLWSRERLQYLFSFTYRNSMYDPAGSRVGYYVMPLLHRGKLCGRLDARADRATNSFRVDQLSLEDDECRQDQSLGEIAGALRELATFASCSKVELRTVTPSRLRRKIRPLL